MKTKFKDYLKSDAIGYNIGDYIYHVTPEKNIKKIKKDGFVPTDGTSITGKKFKNRLYFATSLIAAYDLSINFSSYREDNDNYVIFKIDSKCLKDYQNDPLFVHGIYIDYKISSKFIVDVIAANSLFNKYDENDLEDLY